MKRSSYLQRQSERNDVIAKIAFSHGEQYAADMFAIAAEQNGVSRPTIIAITKEAMELRREYSAAVNTVTNNEADVAQDHIDKALQRIYGDLFCPFNKRYEFLKEVKY